MTEFVINGLSHTAYFNRADMQRFLLHSHGMELAESTIDFRIAKNTVCSYVDIEKDPPGHNPQVVLKRWGHLWTSIILFFRKR